MATINQVIDIVDQQKPNAYNERIKKHWLDQMDRMVFRDVISTHENGAEEFAGYTDETDGETVLLLPDDFKQVYVYWLSAMMDYANGETNRYTNDMIMFNQTYGDYEAWYNRTHMPKGQVIRGAEGRILR